MQQVQDKWKKTEMPLIEFQKSLKLPIIGVFNLFPEVSVSFSSHSMRVVEFDMQNEFFFQEG